MGHELTASRADRPCAEIEVDKSVHTQVKRKIAFALLMGIVTTGVISFAILALNVGFSETFALTWLRSWGIGYVIVVPVILVVGPWLQAQVNRMIQ